MTERTRPSAEPQTAEQRSPRFAPPSAARHVARSRLTERIARSDGGTTLLCAAAGWGKTLLLADWLEHTDIESAVAWLTLGTADDDTQSFWGAVSEALAGSAAPADKQAFYRASSAPGADGTTTALAVASAVDQVGRPTTLVLDGLEVISDPDIHAGLEALVEAQPRYLKLVIATRHDPPWALRRNRVSGVLTEIRAADLAFDVDEAVELFEYAGVDLDEASVKSLVERTEGWAAALQLAAARLRSTADADRFVTEFSGSEHTVTDYLLEEILLAQPAEVLDFLTAVSVVEVVCADLADAITTRTDANARLRELASSNLLVQAVNRDGAWFRVPTLVADVLRHRLVDPARRRALHGRAAHWYQRHELPQDALTQAVAAADWDLAGQILGTDVVDFVVRRNPLELEATLSGIPHEVLVRHAELACGLAAARTMMGVDRGVAELLTAGRARLAELPPERRARTELVLGVVQLAVHRIHGDIEQVAASAKAVPEDYRAFDTLGLRSWDVLVAIAQGSLGSAKFWLGDPAAQRRLEATIELGTATAIVVPRLNAQGHLALLLADHGELDAARELAEGTVAELDASGWEVSGQAGPAYLAQQTIALIRDEPGAFAAAALRMQQVLDRIPEPNMTAMHAVLAARSTASDGSFATAARELLGAITSLSTRPVVPRMQDLMALAMADILVRSGDLAGAVEHYESTKARDSAVAAAVWFRLTLAGAGAVGPDEVALRAERLVSDNSADALSAVELMVLASMAHDRNGNTDSARSLLEAALGRAAPQQLRSPFLQADPAILDATRRYVDEGGPETPFAVALLDRHDRNVRAGRAATRVSASAMTERELTMLRYLASSLSNTEIAAELFVSVNTVKTHQRTIYRKLAVGDRRAAVRRGRELGLI